jgi:hypothetical protein
MSQDSSSNNPVPPQAQPSAATSPAVQAAVGDSYINLGISAGLLTAAIISAGGWMLSTIIDHKARIHRIEEAIKGEEEIKRQISELRGDIKDMKRDLERKLERTQDQFRANSHTHQEIPRAKKQ